MCGITGFLDFNIDVPKQELEERLGSMTWMLHHRGPDDRGVWTDGKVGLGHARLSIIDLSSAGHQPMTENAGRLVVVFNGEIYNFIELRSELEGIGYSFKSNTDTEVIVKGYLAWGTRLFERLRGMFAIAIWDNLKRELILVRDRIGKKPLCYSWENNRLIFGSEIKAILAWPGFPREPDLEAIHHYLSWQYVPAPWTAFAGISRLPQSHFMVFREGRQPETVRYASLPTPDKAWPRKEKDLKEQLVSHLEEAVRIRMVSDVPLGAFLSGGVDSSAVVAMMARQSSSRIRTFCIGFEEEEFDEREYARMVAERYDTDHQEFVVRPDAVSVLPSIVWQHGEPFADPSAIPTYYVSELAAREVGVVLNGDGGDEAFLGYGRYKACRENQWIDKLPYRLRSAATKLESILESGDHNRYVRAIRRRLREASTLNSRRYAPSMAYFYDQDKETGYGDRLRPYLEQSSLDLIEPYFRQAKTYLSGAAWADIHTYLPDDLLVKVDIASMAHSLEARSPLLDQELMEFAAGIPDHQKFKGKETKWLLKSAMEPYLPHEVLYRPKMGFGVPIERWICNEMKEFVRDTLLSDRARDRQLFSTSFIETQLSEHCEGVRFHHTRIWAMLMLELWWQMWIDPPAGQIVKKPKPASALSRLVNADRPLSAA